MRTLNLHLPDRDEILDFLARFANTPADQLDTETIERMQDVIRTNLPPLKADIPVVLNEALLLTMPETVTRNAKLLRDVLICEDIDGLRADGMMRDAAIQLVADVLCMSFDTVLDIYKERKKTIISNK